MGYTSVEKRNSAGASIPAKPVSVGGYVPVSSRTAPVATPSRYPGSVGGYIPVDKRPEGFVPLQTVKTPAPTVVEKPKGPGIVSKVSNTVGEAVNTPANKTTMPELPADFKTRTPEEKKKISEQYTKDLEDWRKKNDFGSNLPSSIMESLPFGLGHVFKQIHEEENIVKNNPEYAEFSPLTHFDNKDLIKELPGATLEAAKGFVKAPISGAVNIYDTVAKKKTKFNIPGLGEVSSAQYRTAERVANGEDPVQVAIEEGSTAILDTLFFISLAAKPFQGRPTTTAKGEVSAHLYEKVPGASKALQPKSFRLYEPKTSARPLSPAFLEQAKAQGINLGPKFNPDLPTYFKMSFKPKTNSFVGEIVQIKPSYAKMLTNLFGKKADPGYQYVAKDLGRSGHDLDRAIESGDMPVQKIYKNKQGQLTPEYAQHVISDLAGKLDNYKPGLGAEFKKVVDMKNPTPTNLDTQALALLNSAATGSGAKVPVIVSPPLGLSPAQVEATPPAQLEVLHTKEIKADDIENASKNPIVEEVIPENTTTPQERANALMGIPNKIPAKKADVPFNLQGLQKANPELFRQAQKATNVDEFIGAVVKSGNTKIENVSVPILTEFFNKVKTPEVTENKIERSPEVERQVQHEQDVAPEGSVEKETKIEVPAEKPAKIKEQETEIILFAGDKPNEEVRVIGRGQIDGNPVFVHISPETGATVVVDQKTRLKIGESRYKMPKRAIAEVEEFILKRMDGDPQRVKNLIAEAQAKFLKSEDAKKLPKSEKAPKGAEKTQKEKVEESIKEKPKSIKEISEETKIKEPNVRRILGVGAKEGVFERVDKGVYILSKDGQDLAYVEVGDALESLPRLAGEGFKADMIFLDIPYDTPAIKGGNRGMAYNLISVEEFGKVLDATGKIVRDEKAPVIHMFSQAPSGMKAMQKYNDLFIEKGWKPVGRGQWQKMFANGKPVTNVRGEISKPEGILVFTKSGELKKDLKNLNFTLTRPKGYQSEKSADMLKAMIEMTTEEGEMVLDPFAGSGVTGAEAVRAGRKAYLIEKDAEVAETITKPRVKEAIEDKPEKKSEPFADSNKQEKKQLGGTSGNASIGEFRDGTPLTLGQKENIKIIELPEMVDLARELMGEVPKIREKVSRHFGGRARGVFIGKEGGEIRLRADLFDPKVSDINQAAKTLAHEIGHLIDYLPEGTLARGNLLGRLATLKKFGKEFLPEAGPTRSNTDMRTELWELSKYWKPVDEATASKGFMEYRKSSKEIYADFISVVFNDPKLAQEMAPATYNAFFKMLDKKPDVMNAFFEMQEILGGDRNSILNRRREGVRGMFEKGDMMASDIQKARMAKKEAENKRLLFQFKFNLVDKNQAMIDRINEMAKQGKPLSDDENPLYYLEERNYLGGKIKSFMETNVQPIYKKLGDNEISWTDFGEALFYDRIRAGDRSAVANPRGITPEAAEELLQKQLTELGEEKAKILVDSMEDFRGALKEVTQEAFEEGLYKPEMHEQMQKNPAYATFQVLDYLEEGMTSKIHKSLGTLKDVSNPADASLLKTISTLRAIERNKVTKSVVEFLEKNFKEDILPAKTINTPKGSIPQESKLPGQELITYMKDGKRVGFYVDRYIRDSVENNTIGHTIGVLRIMNSALFRPLFITYNPGFQAFNFLRDFQRFWKNTPGMTVIKALRLYRQSIPVAKARAWGDTTNEILQKLERDQILSISYNQLTDGADVESAQIETILRNSGIDSFKPEVRYKALQPFVKVLDFVKSMGDFVETLPKVAGYLEFSEGGKKELTREQESFIRKNIGSPDFLAGGFWKPVTNEVFLFSNAITQGVRSDIGVATDPKTRSGYWYKTAQMNILPKILMWLATAGFFGAAVKEIMDGASEYDKTSYTIIPLGIDENGKPIYFRMPQDEGGRLIGSLAWKLINSGSNEQSFGRDLIDMASLTGGQIPSITPVVSNAVATGQFISGQNPYDWFRNREVLTDDQFKAGGMYAAKPFFGWLFNQSGGGIFYRFNQGAPREKSSTEKLIGLPVVSNTVGRFFRVSDYGKTEELNQIKEKVQSEQSKRRLDENAIIGDYISEAQKNLSDASIEELVAQNKSAMVNEVLGHAPATKEELARANNIVKKYQVGLKRGEADPVINSLISAVTNEEKIELLTEIRKTMTPKEYNALMLETLKYKIVSPEVFIKIPNPAKTQ